MDRSAPSLASPVVPRHFRSVAFRGEWPTGIHWSPGEERVIPPGFVVDGPPPAGLEAVGAAEAAGGEE